jgi:flagellar hook-length control protein FliK
MQTIPVTSPATIAPADAHASRAEDDDIGSPAFGQELALMMMPDAAKPAAPDAVAGYPANSPAETAGVLDAARIVDSLIAPAGVSAGGNVPGGANGLPDANTLVDPLAVTGAILTGASTATDSAPLVKTLRAAAARDAAALAFAAPLASQTSALAGELRLAPSQTAEALADSAEMLDARGMRDPRGLRGAGSISREVPAEPLVTAFGAGSAALTEPTLSFAGAASPLDTLSSAVLTGHSMPAVRSADTAPTPATAHIDSPFGTEGWKDAFQQKIVWLVDRQQQSAELHLNPPNLGPVEVMLSMSDDRANIVFVSPHAAVRDAIEASLAELRTALGERGLAMGDALVSADAGSAREQAQREAAQAARHARDGSLALAGDLPGDLPRPRTSVLGLVDTFA